MYLNKLVFPAPRCSYSEDILKNNLIWVERPKNGTKGLTELEKGKEGLKDGLQIDQSDPFQNIGPFQSTQFNRKSLGAVPEGEVTHDLFASVPNLNKIGQTQAFSKLRSSNTIEIDKFPTENQTSPRVSLEEIDLKMVPDIIPQEASKKQQKRGGCFGFFSRSKTKTSPPHPHKNYTISTRTSNVSVKTMNEDNFNDPPSDDSKGRSLSEPKIAKSPKTAEIVKIPCLHLVCKIPTKTTLLFFHSNGEDIYQTYELLQFFSDHLFVNVFAVEYPGYGIYKGNASEKNVLLDAEAAYNYLLNNLNCKEEDIIVAGRSLGSGPATWLASFTNPSLLVLISPFTSIRGVVKHAFGNTARYLIKERFNNLKRIPAVKCPVFILHGKNDQLIPPDQASKLYDAVKGPKSLYIAEEMDHASFDFMIDLIQPLKKFMAELKGPRIVTRRSRVLPSKIFKDIPVIELTDSK